MNKSIMQNALGDQWQDLPEALKNHYKSNDKGENYAQGTLDIDYPWFMQWPLSIMRMMGGLPNRRGKGLRTTVSKTMKGDKQHWQRIIQFPHKKQIQFNSILIADEDGFVEYVNAFLGLKMMAFVKEALINRKISGFYR